MAADRSFMYSSLPRPGSNSTSRIPPPSTPTGRVLQPVAPPNTDYSRMAPPPAKDANLMLPPSKAQTATFKARQPTSAASATSPSLSPNPAKALGDSGEDRTPLFLPRPLPWKVTKYPPDGNKPTRISLADRAAQGKQISHANSLSQSTNAARTPAIPQSTPGRPASSLGIARTPSMSRLPGSRPASAQDMRTEQENIMVGPGGGVLPKMPKRQGWDVKAQLADHEVALKETMNMCMKLNERLTSKEEEFHNEAICWETKRATLETGLTQAQYERDQTKEKIAEQRYELESIRKRLSDAERTVEDEQRARRQEREDATRRLRDETDDLRRRHRDELDNLKRSHQQGMEVLEMKLRQQLMDEKTARTKEVQDVKIQAAQEKQQLEIKMDGSGRETKGLKMDLAAITADLEREIALNKSLRDKISEQDVASLGTESATRALKAKIESLENQGHSQAQSYVELQRQLQEKEEKLRSVEEKLRNEEVIRRRLHNQVQELKGNIRVFCRVRPTLEHEHENAADIRFPDNDLESKEIEVLGAPEKSALGKELTKRHPFTFDKVFAPTQQNGEIFEEISQLVQSALDGYNVCIFCYGQTGSGKTYTMTSDDGMIPRAVAQIYETAKGLEDKGWTYTMEGNFVEVYNENINDLLGKPDDLDKKKHEIRHDPKECKTIVTDVETVTLDNPAQVKTILQRANRTRSVAATKANERSSRSHSVFILRLIGVNSATGQRSEGTLNLVDLAGSERLSHSQSTGERLKETQSINRSLSCLGDVIAALGSGKEGAHIPYRNSKLTYLLQYSLGGNSKCLMFVMVSPMMAHLNESLTSLKFATKVNNTTIGTAKKQIKVSDGTENGNRR